MESMDNFININDDIPFWVPNTHITGAPKHAVKAGFHSDDKIFIGRARHEGSLTPGGVYQNSDVCLIPWGCISNAKQDFEYLVSENEVKWVEAENGVHPQNAYCAGHSEGGEPLYIGRVKHESGALLVGKIQESHKVCYVPYSGRELNYKKYEVMVI